MPASFAKTKTLLVVLLIALCPVCSFATSWNEPWAEKVIKEADAFVQATVLSYDEEKGVKIKILKQLAGEKLPDQLKVTDFYALNLTSRSGNHGPEFHFDGLDKSYFFIKKTKKGAFEIATPTSGFDYIKQGNVHATYRHSYHQALVPVEVYEKNMTAIFNRYHNKPYNTDFANNLVIEHLSVKPAGFKENEVKTFFAQHVALESIYHLQLQNHFQQILPFLNDTANFHNQVSAARALSAYNTLESKRALLAVIADTSQNHFVQVMCIWSLAEMKPTDLKAQLVQLLPTASEEHNGFGGNIMDPRVGTRVPTVKQALEDLIASI